MEFLPATLIPVVAILMPVLIVFIALYFKHQRQLQVLETVRYLADKGLPVPKDLLDPPARQKGSPLSVALTTIGVGVGLIIFFRVMDMGGLWGIGALTVCIGAAQLLAFLLERKRQPATIESPKA
jgi:hypothetical protein